MVEIESDLVCLSSSDEEEEDKKTVAEKPKLEGVKEEDDHDYEVLTLDSDDDDIVCVENEGKKDAGKILNGGVISDGSDDEVSVVMTIDKQPVPVDDSETDDEIPPVVENQNEEDVEETEELHVEHASEDFEPGTTVEEVVDEREEEEGVPVDLTEIFEESEPIVEEPADEEENFVEECDPVVEEPDDEEENLAEESVPIVLEPDDEDKVQHGVIVQDVTDQLSEEEDDETGEVDIEGDDVTVKPTLERLHVEMTPPRKMEGMETPSKMEVDCDSDVDVLEENVSHSQETSLADDDDILVLDDPTHSHETESPVKGLPPNSSPFKLESYQALDNLYKVFCSKQFALTQKHKRKVYTKLFKGYDKLARSPDDVHSNLVTAVEKARVAISCSKDKWVTLRQLLDYMKSLSCGDKVVSPEKKPLKVVSHCSSRPPPSPGPSPLKSSSSPSKLSEAEREEKKNALRMQYEKQLSTRLKELRELETQEVDLDDGEDSVYLLHDKCTKALMKDFYKLCDVTHSSHFTGQHTQKKITLRKPSGYPSIDRNLEKLVNAGGILNLPDYSDVFKIVQGGAAEAGLDSDKVEEISKKLFKSIVDQIKERREKEFKVSMLKWLPPAVNPEDRLNLEEVEGSEEEDEVDFDFDKDPANEDPELERKLRENAAQRRTELEIGEEFDRRNEEQSGDADAEETDEEEEEEQWKENAHDFGDELSEDDEPEMKKRKLCSEASDV